MSAPSHHSSANSAGKAVDRRHAWLTGKAPVAIGISCAIWLVCAAAGLGYLAHYASTPGPTRLIPATWPGASSIHREAGKATLVIFLHPRCPCSQATVGELARALAWSSVPMRLCAVFYAPAQADEDWTQTSLRSRVEALDPGCVLVDEAGREATIFGVVTSGHVLFYDADGSLAFEGGITHSRGHEGDSTGRAALLALLAGQLTARQTTPVYGCLLRQSTLAGCTAEECVEAHP